jgi:RHS repeat-associated protein
VCVPDSYQERSTTSYSYQQAGNVTAIAGTTNGTADQEECFRYDYLRRLTEAWTQPSGACTSPQRTGADPYWRQWTFDLVGNRVSEVDKNTTDTIWTHTVGAAGSVKPHQVQSITATGTPTRTFTYDAAGNTRTRTTATGAAQTLDWDRDGHLASVTEAGVTTTYIYDTAGNRLVSSSPSKKILYLPDGTQLEKNGTADPVATRYYGGFAVRDAFGVRWIVADHHGTAVSQIDSTTLAVQRRRSMPYGEPRGPQATDWKGTKGFVGGTTDDTGLTHLGAREYDPTIGRFISDDPITDFTDPQQLNGYAYSNNNPTTLSDPSGLKSIDEEERRFENAPGGKAVGSASRRKGTGSTKKRSGLSVGLAVGARAGARAGRPAAGAPAYAALGGILGGLTGDPTPSPSPDYCKTPESLPFYCTPDPNMPEPKCKDFDPRPCDGGPQGPIETPSHESEGMFNDLVDVFAVALLMGLDKIVAGLYIELSVCVGYCVALLATSDGLYQQVGGIGCCGPSLTAGWNSARPTQTSVITQVVCGGFGIGYCSNWGKRNDGTTWRGGGVTIGAPGKVLFIGATRINSVPMIPWDWTLFD